MSRNLSVQKLTSAALLIAVGILIPIVMPFKFVMEPVSFTLASHVALFISMFISPGVAVSVALGTTLGFLLGGFPFVIVMRAASHIVFAAVGSIYLSKHRGIMSSPKKIAVFSLVISLIHGACEVAVVSLFYFGGNVSAGFYDKGFFVSVVLLVGLGTVVHSMFDFAIAVLVTQPLVKQKSFKPLFSAYN